MKIPSIIIKLLPWIFDIAKKIWAGLSKNKKATIEKAIKAGQIIKANLTADPNFVIENIALQLGIPKETVLAALTGVAFAMRRSDLSPQEVIFVIQTEVSVDAKILDEFVRNFVTGIGGDVPSWEEIALGAVKAGFDILKSEGKI